MNNIPKPHEIERLKEAYPPGTRVELIEMNDPYSTLKPGDIGEVICVDALGTLHTNWTNGSTLGLVFNEDRFRKAPEIIAEKVKPKMKLHGQDGNIFSILGNAKRALARAGMHEEAKEMFERVTNSDNYYAALNIISEYVETELSAKEKGAKLSSRGDSR